MRVAVFGLGEAGSLISADLAAQNVEVHGYDPGDVPTPDGVKRHDDPSAAVDGAEMTLAITAAEDARQAMSQAWGLIDPGSIYADMATASPELEGELAGRAAERGIAFADVALMAPVPGRGLGTPALASGAGAHRLAKMLNPLGAEITVIGEEAGIASGRKLLRSVITKGVAALILEVAEAGDARGDRKWVEDHIEEFLTTLDRQVIERLVSGTGRHARRRMIEMETVADFLTALGVEPHMARATAERLRHLVEP